jgi:hypothetical protein
MNKEKSSYLVLGVLALLLLAVLAACTPSGPEVETPTAETAVETVETAPTEAIITSPTPQTPPSVLLVWGDGVDSFTRSQIQSALEGLAADSALELIVVEAVTPDMLTPEVEAVIGVGAELGLNELAAGAPNVSFLAIGDPGADVAANLSLIGDPNEELRQKAFLAGYISAVISYDNKIVAFINAENAASEDIVDSYVTGARFFCGICRNVFPPYNAFPQWELLTPDLANDGFRPIVNNYFNIDVDVVYVQGSLATPGMLAYFDELGIQMIGDQPPDVQPGLWAGTILADPVPALETLWPELLAGSQGKQIPARLIVTDRESGLISEGRFRLIEIMIADLESGLVSVESAPQ